MTGRGAGRCDFNGEAARGWSPNSIELLYVVQDIATVWGIVSA